MWKQVMLNNREFFVNEMGLIKDGESGRIKAAKPNPNGYPCVYVSRQGRNMAFTVHSIVMQAFVGPRPEGYHINHKNGIKTDNRLENLEYVTPAYNSKHAWDNGLHLSEKKPLIIEKEKETQKRNHGLASRLWQKEICEKLYQNGATQTQIHYMTRVSKKTLCKWFKQWNEKKLTQGIDSGEL